MDRPGHALHVLARSRSLGIRAHQILTRHKVTGFEVALGVGLEASEIIFGACRCSRMCMCTASALSHLARNRRMPDRHGRPARFSQIDSAAEQEQIRLDRLRTYIRTVLSGAMFCLHAQGYLYHISYRYYQQNSK